MREQNVAEHSLNVAILTGALCDDLELTTVHQLQAMKLAVAHDVEEVYTGDIPTPLKACGAVDETKVPYQKLLGRIYDWVNVDRGIPKRVVKIADAAEAVKYLRRYGYPQDTHAYRISNQIEKHVWDMVDALEERHTYLPIEKARWTLLHYMRNGVESQFYEHIGEDIQEAGGKAAGK